MQLTGLRETAPHILTGTFGVVTGWNQYQGVWQVALEALDGAVNLVHAQNLIALSDKVEVPAYIVNISYYYT